MFHRGRVDINQPAIVKALEAVGASVLVTSDLGQGLPDLVVGFRLVNYLLEVKNPATSYGRRGLNPLQERWATLWTGSPVRVVRSTEEALCVVDAIGCREWQRIEREGNILADRCGCGDLDDPPWVAEARRAKKAAR